ncbi:protein STRICTOSIDINE SYNTHASE-LIKE 5-like [Actinidia eriantha]|uniref:protein STRICTOSIDINE SYNTHASE-LIKE 5-like n=1 Tax=Actinidia eriantha TaxID=165200 RepID=UPI0025896118|nr:protein STRICTOSIDINE SYNTHASE-LIKE 5-like [Actinidia eriantha]
MSDSTPPDSLFPSPAPPSNKTTTTFLLLFLVPVIAAVLLYRLDPFDPAPIPTHEFARRPMSVPLRNPHLLEGAEMLGVGQLLGPEDLVHDPDSGVVYTGCHDGWIKRVTVNKSVTDSVVEEWVNTGGRPLGLVLGLHKEVIVADSDKGLLKVSREGDVEVLTKEAEGVEFKLTDGVDVTEEGIIYFTDASTKYSLNEFIWDMFEGRPYGRFMSYDPSTKQTLVLVRDIYFANGVAVSPDQNFVVFCETPMRRCKRYYIKGEKKGSVDIFIDNLPGVPDNIRYDGEGQFWIGLSTEVSFYWDLAQKYPLIRKCFAIMERYVGRPHMEKNGGLLAVDMEGKPLAHYHDRQLSLITGGLKIGPHLYCCSLVNPYIIRLDLTQYPALPSTGSTKS